jgi:TATA-box binding protein (TBP) (component of TFIID and TFIIIB)
MYKININFSPFQSSIFNKFRKKITFATLMNFLIVFSSMAVNAYAADTTTPEFRSLELSTNIINVTDGSQELTLTITLFDAESTIDRAYFYIYPGPDVNGPHRKELKMNSAWIAGEEANTYVATANLTFDQDDPAGTWLLRNGYIVDSNGNTVNSATITNGDPYITVINPVAVDTTPPEFRSLTLSTNTVDVTNGSQQVALTFTVFDAESTIDSLWFNIIPPNRSETYRKNITLNGDWLIGEEANTYVNTAIWTLNDTDIEGNWTVEILTISDSIGNSYWVSTNVTANDIRNSGSIPNITVITGAAATVFDSKVELVYDDSQISTSQLSEFKLTIESEEKYELSVFSNDSTNLTTMNFFDSSNSEISCQNSKDRIICTFSATPEDEYITAKISSYTSNASDFGLQVFLTPKGNNIESDWSSNAIIVHDIDGDGINNNVDTDDDNDGVLDVDDAFPLDDTESVDTDLDGIGNNADTDDDNDGVLDVDDAFPLDATESVDTDGDDIGNNTDTDDDNDGVLDADDAFPLDDTESVDTDLDGIGNNADTDDDNDGILDEDDSAPLDGSIGDDESPVFSELADVVFEATGTTTDLELVVPEVSDNNLNAPSVVSDYSDALPLGTHEITWTATDFAGNVTTAVQLVTIVDTTNPKFDDLQTQTIDATGVLSDISDAINNVQAYDLVDENINAVVIGDTIYPSGAHLVPVAVTDSSGNIAEADVEVHINPLVELSQSRKVEPGATALLPVTLSGNAAVYPVGVTYTLMQSGSIIETNELTITEDISGVITIEIPNDALDGDIYSVAITSANNAVLGFITSTQLTVDEANLAPTLMLVTQQDDKNISVVDTTNGVVTVTAIINDINVNDTHDIVWSSLNDTLVDLNTDGLASTFEFSAEGLTTDTYKLTVNVSESNTSELFSVSVDEGIVVDVSLAALDANTDSDNDGISDADEGYSDSDNDGISDYLDTDDNPSRLPIDDSTASMQTVNGLSLSLGDVVTTSYGATASNATVDVNDMTSDEHFTTLSSITNFNVSGLTEVGQSVPIVIPLASGNTIAEGNVYRKYSDVKGWFDFVVDSENGVYSALADEDGNCPYPQSTQYQEGLTAGDNCIQLLIKDGGDNDADGFANGMVKDPGVLTSEAINQPPVIVVNTNETVNEGSVFTFDASATTDAENDALTYQWVRLTGATVELSGQDTATLSFTAPQVSNDESLTFELTVNDGRDSSVTEVEVLVLQVNVAPMVSIDNHASSFDEGATISLTAIGTDEDGDALSYEWEQTSGVVVTLSGASSATVSFTAPAVSSDQSFEFKVTASDGIDVVSKTATVTIKNVAPVIQPSESSGGGGSMGWILIVMSFGLLRKRLRKVAA